MLPYISSFRSCEYNNQDNNIEDWHNAFDFVLPILFLVRLNTCPEIGKHRQGPRIDIYSINILEGCLQHQLQLTFHQSNIAGEKNQNRREELYHHQLREQSWGGCRPENSYMRLLICDLEYHCAQQADTVCTKRIPQDQNWTFSGVAQTYVSLVMNI